jgi:hypothetical protein
MARMQRSLFAQLNALAEEISQSKSAAVKSAGPVPADPGGYQGASTHPSASADNNVQNAPEGARASEYEADVKKQQGALAVDNTPEMSPEGRQDDVQLNINAHASTVGDDPSVEKDYKGTKDDPGTAHPAKANDGEKYSHVSFKQARDLCGNLGNDILANIINFGASKLTKQSEMPEGLKDHEKKESPAEEKAEHAEGGSELKGDQHKLDVDNDGKIEGSDLAALRAGKEAAFKAGYEIAKAAGVEKSAAEAAVREVCANTLRDADVMADLLIGFLSSQKAANSDVLDEAAEGEDHSAPGDEDSGAGDAPVGGDAGGGLEGMMAGGDAGGMPPEVGGEMGGAPSEDEAVQELAMALEELGISPEELLSAVSEGGAGGPGAGAMGGEMPPAAAAPEMAPKMAAARDLNDIGRAVVNFKRAGRFQLKEARTKRSRELRDTMKQHVIELLNR